MPEEESKHGPDSCREEEESVRPHSESKGAVSESNGPDDNESNQDEHTCYMKFELGIQDFGCGISEEKLGGLFINFNNLEEHRKTNPSGRGLGLSICKMIVEQMGGTVNVTS